MTNDVNHIENQPELNREMREMISGTSIAWSKTKEEIWPEMLEKMENKSPASHNTRVVYLQLKRLAVAAVFLILLGIPAVMYFYTKTVENPLGQSTEAFLPDNSRVMVNAQSVLSYKPLLWRFSRAVKFEGEAFFEVQKGKRFEVVSKRGKTVVLGTQFNIYSRSNDYNVTCVSGKVKVIELAHQNEAVLTAGQKAILKPDGTFEIQDINNTQPETSSKSQNKTVDEELNEVLSTDAAQGPANKEQNQVQANKPAVVKEQAAVKEQDKTDEQNALKEQNKSQNQTVEELQNKELSKTTTQTQAENKGQSPSQEQAKAKEQSTGNQQNKDKFRASLTPEQISILDNRQMSKEEKKKAFMESLSPEQRKLLKEQNEERARQTDNKKEPSGSDNMKEQMREQVRESTGKESQEQQKQQNLENKENAKQSSEKGSGSGNGAGSQTGKGN